MSTTDTPEAVPPLVAWANSLTISMDEHTRRVNEVRSADLLALQKIKTRNDELERLVSNFELVYLESMASLKATVAERDGLNAARFAYASEFGLDEEGQPDVGSIHQNIRELKAERDQLRAELDARWRPIETAPKGQSVLLWVTRGGDRCVIDDWGDYDRHNHPRITHWMPLPAAPTPPNADQKGQ